MPRPRLSIGTLMMVVLASAAAAALYARAYQHLSTPSRNLPGHPVHLAAEFVPSPILLVRALAA